MSRYELKYIDPDSEFLQNAWYVAMQSGRVEAGLNPIAMLGERLVLFHGADGKLAALEDACPHRKLPLSMGSLEAGIVSCGYHGLCFDATGRCVRAPTQAKIPGNAFVRSYPVVEKYGLVWIWMGDPALADDNRLPAFADYDNPDWGLTPGGMLECRCHYLYLLDNLLDPSHVAWVHETSFASAGTEDVPLLIEDTDTGVLVSRWIRDIDPPPYYAEMLPFAGRVDRQQYYEAVVPSLAINMSTYARAGEGGDLNDLPDDAYRMRSYHFITPIDSHNTRYHWFQHYNTSIDDDDGAAEAERRRAFRVRGRSRRARSGARRHAQSAAAEPGPAARYRRAQVPPPAVGDDSRGKGSGAGRVGAGRMISGLDSFHRYSPVQRGSITT